MPSLKEETLAACQSALARLGFVKHKGALLQELGEESSGWIGLNLATYALPRLLKVNPVVGVRFAHLERILLTLSEDMPKKPAPVVSMPLGYLMPGHSFRSWDFLEGEDVRVSAESLADAVREYGEPYISRYSDWAEFSRNADEGILMEHERAKILPIVHVINGSRGEARRIIETELQRIIDSRDAYALSYRSFAQKFQREFG
ncbi:hypothetical protein ACRWOO_10350 [Streptomyces sp. NEAU-PBA10]|uniref:hypothetical protein n=1 Tax=unclassified Streptomyces TaxID=2593676 RepID=UPI001D0560AC|nr:hypothetical protein [Streptomyces sp. WA1-19]UDF07775.1 hypothetical protein LH646_09515 [Streptomyces sp. WA1-19]